MSNADHENPGHSPMTCPVTMPAPVPGSGYHPPGSSPAVPTAPASGPVPPLLPIAGLTRPRPPSA